MKVEWEEQGVAVLLPDIVKETTVGKFSLPLPRVASWRDGDCLDRDRNSEWDEQLNFSLLASCITKNESTGFSPFELLYGRPPRLPTFVQPDNKPMFWSPTEEQK